MYMAFGTAKKNSTLIYEKIETGPYSFAANTWTDISVNVKKDGYTPLCALPWGTRGQYLLWMSCRLDNSTTATATIRSLSGSVISHSIDIGVLYVKDL